MEHSTVISSQNFVCIDLCLFFIRLACCSSQTGSLSHVLDDDTPRSCQRVVRNSFDYSAGDVPFFRNTGSAFSPYGDAGGVLPFRGTAELGLALIKPWVSQKRVIILYLGLFQRSLPQFLLQCRQRCSVKLNTCSKANARTYFQGSDFVGSAGGVQGVCWLPRAPGGLAARGASGDLGVELLTLLQSHPWGHSALEVPGGRSKLAPMSRSCVSSSHLPAVT